MPTDPRESESVESRCQECGHAASEHVPAAETTAGRHACLAPSGDRFAGSDFCSCSRSREECGQPKPPRQAGLERRVQRVMGNAEHVDDCSCGMNASETTFYTDPRCAALGSGTPP